MRYFIPLLLFVFGTGLRALSDLAPQAPVADAPEFGSYAAYSSIVVGGWTLQFLAFMLVAINVADSIRANRR